MSAVRLVDAEQVNVLVVDDSRLIRQLAQVALESAAGWQVRAVETGAEALELARTEPPEAILLDALMPDMDGAATLAGLQSSPATRDIPVIVVTAMDRPEEHAEFVRLGAIGVISKPFQVHRLARQVSELLGRSS